MIVMMVFKCLWSRLLLRFGGDHYEKDDADDDSFRSDYCYDDGVDHYDDEMMVAHCKNDGDYGDDRYGFDFDDDDMMMMIMMMMMMMMRMMMRMMMMMMLMMIVMSIMIAMLMMIMMTKMIMK
jgi:hypothetical protein